MYVMNGNFTMKKLSPGNSLPTKVFIKHDILTTFNVVSSRLINPASDTIFLFI